MVLPQKFREADHETSKEENELPGQKRAPYGSGWWGRGSPLMTSRKGCAVPAAVPASHRGDQHVAAKMPQSTAVFVGSARGNAASANIALQCYCNVPLHVRLRHFSGDN